MEEYLHANIYMARGMGKNGLSLAESNIVIGFFFSLYSKSNPPDFASPSSGEEGHIHIRNAIFGKMDKEREGSDIFILVPNATEDSVCRNRKCV